MNAYLSIRQSNLLSGVPIGPSVILEHRVWVLKGYRKVIQLSDDEFEVLFLAIKTRAAMSVIAAYHTVLIDPINRQYLMSEAGQAQI